MYSVPSVFISPSHSIMIFNYLLPFGPSINRTILRLRILFAGLNREVLLHDLTPLYHLFFFFFFFFMDVILYIILLNDLRPTAQIIM